MYNMEDYLKLLEGLRVEDDLPETVDADDLALLFEAMAGAFDEISEMAGENGYEDDSETPGSQLGDLVKFECPMTTDQRDAVYKAINRCKNAFNFNSTAEALTRICDEY
jgi:hypothetical protein